MGCIWCRCVPLFLFVADGAGAAPASEHASFVRWAQEYGVPLSASTAESQWEDIAPVGKMIGNASIVAFSEGTHFAAEPLEFRNRLLQYLVQEKAFTAIAIESGIVESRRVHDYVRGGAGEFSDVLTEGISWTFDQLPQNRALVRWMREFNADPGHARKVNFYGFDVPGSPGNASARRGLDTALRTALEYLDHVDTAEAEAFQTRLRILLPNVRFDMRRSPDAPGYDRLSPAERDTLTAIIADLVTLFERREGQYTTATAVADYEWAYRAAIGAQQVDRWLRQIPLGWRPASDPVTFPSEHTRFLSVASDVRDRAQADNLDWIIREEGPAGKVLVFAHRYHLSGMPVKARYWLPREADQHLQEPAGTYLHRRFGPRLISIGSLIGRGEIGCGEFKHTLEQALPSSLDAIAGEAGMPRFLLDLRVAPVPVAKWLTREHLLGQGQERLELAVRQAFDVLFYIDAVTPACSVH